MVKYPEFDKRERFGTSIEDAVPPSRVTRTPEDRIAEGDQVRLHYKNRQLFVIVINVWRPKRDMKGAYRDLWTLRLRLKSMV
jgi:hypothetical protein